MIAKICTKEKCGYTTKPCVTTISGWDSALCHCLIDGKVVVWVHLNKVDTIVEDPCEVPHDSMIEDDFYNFCPYCGADLHE